LSGGCNSLIEKIWSSRAESAAAYAGLAAEIPKRVALARRMVESGDPSGAWNVLDGRDSMAGSRYPQMPLTALLTDLNGLEHDWHEVDYFRLMNLATGHRNDDLPGLLQELSDAFNANPAPKLSPAN
jgi:hypothetical protein